MMGIHLPQKALFSYQVDLDRRVRADHPLRRLNSILDLSFVRAEIARCYGHKGHVSVDPVVLVKLMIRLFLEDIPSERELISRLAERLEYLWFLDFGLDTCIPNHSVLSKARNRWGAEAFEQIFVRSVRQCVEAGLVDGRKLHVDSSPVDANAGAPCWRCVGGGHSKSRTGGSSPHRFNTIKPNPHRRASSIAYLHRRCSSTAYSRTTIIFPHRGEIVVVDHAQELWP